MKEQTKKNLKTAASVTGLALGATYLVMRHIAKKQYPDSVYANQPEEQNPVQGRKVVFVENANDPVNADGKQGHLEAVANTTHIPTFYEKYIKRGFDVVLSFGGLVVLAPVYAVTALAIKHQNYVFVHFLGTPSEGAIRCINQIASEYELSVVCFANNYNDYDALKSHIFVDGSPYDYVYLIENASFVCTAMMRLISIANALEVTPDDLLADYLTGLTKTSKAEALDLLTDCTPAEKAILMDMLRHMKKLLQEHGI